MEALILDIDKRAHLSAVAHTMRIPLSGTVRFVLELAREPWGYSLEDANLMIESNNHLQTALIYVNEACRKGSDARHALEMGYKSCLDAGSSLAMVSEQDDSTVRQLVRCLDRIQDAVIKALCD